MDQIRDRAAYLRNWRAQNREKYKQSQREATERVRQEALEHYGRTPPKCALCASTEELRISPLLPNENAYVLRKQGWPEGRRVLCWACVRKERGRSIVARKPYLNPETGKHRNDQRAEVECSQCRTKILRMRCHRKRDLHWCSRECMAAWRSENVRGEAHPGFKYHAKEYPCAQCGAIVISKPYHVRPSTLVFCSPACNGLWKAANLTGEKVYNWLGGYEPYYGPSWLQAKRAARKRDNYTCQRCAKTQAELGRALDVHHLIPFRNFGPERHLEANALSNLKSYCNRCHKLVECEAEQIPAVP